MSATAAPTSFETYLRGLAVSKEMIDSLLIGEPNADEPVSMLRFDPLTGFRSSHSLARDGIDGCSTISTFDRSGARTAHVYADRPARINTYGDSFTQGNQVSDAETWQEYLAGHLGEPIRNFGVGGFGVYQAYRRMLREEQSDHGAEYVILYLWGDDHARSLSRCSVCFLPHVEMNLATGELEERDNLLTTPESLYKMTDPDWIADALRDDLALRMSAFAQGAVGDLDMDAVRMLAQRLSFDGPLDVSLPETDVVWELLDRYALAATELTLTKARDFTERHHKKLLVVLFDPVRVMKPMIEGKPRWDQKVVDFLDAEAFRYFDMNLAHVADYKRFAIPFERYIDHYFAMTVPFEENGDRYLKGHYGPAGNHFFAYAIKSTIVDWIEPKPITYENSLDRWTTFETYWRQ